MQISYIPKLDDIRANARFKLIKDDSENKSYVIVDVAHNPASVNHLFKLLEAKFDSTKIRYEAIFGILASKDISEILSIAKNMYISGKLLILNT